VAPARMAIASTITTRVMRKWGASVMTSATDGQVKRRRCKFRREMSTPANCGRYARAQTAARAAEDAGRNCDLEISPPAKKFAVHRRQLHDRRVRRHVKRQSLDGGIEVEQQRPIAIVAHHALDPEERRDPRASGDWRNTVQTARGVQQHVSGG